MEPIKQAIEILKQGGIVIFPTDTAFGIGCRIDDEEAVQKLFKIRKRSEIKATPVLVSGPSMAQKYLQPILQEVKTKLIDFYWPGGLTIVLPCLIEKIPTLVRGGGNTLGIRMPNHSVTLKLIQGVKIPILGPSANFAGAITPYTMDALDKELLRQVDLLLPGECALRQSSTVIDCSINPWKIKRQGAIKIK